MWVVEALPVAQEALPVAVLHIDGNMSHDVLTGEMASRCVDMGFFGYVFRFVRLPAETDERCAVDEPHINLSCIRNSVGCENTCRDEDGALCELCRVGALEFLENVASNAVLAVVAFAFSDKSVPIRIAECKVKPSIATWRCH